MVTALLRLVPEWTNPEGYGANQGGSCFRATQTTGNRFENYTPRQYGTDKLHYDQPG